MRRLLLIVACASVLFGAFSAQASAGIVEGTVEPLEAAQEVKVCVAEAVPGESCVVPKADGTYAFPGLQGKLKIEFVPTFRSRMLRQFYDHKSTFAEATTLSVPEAEVPYGNVNAELIEGGVITGKVTAEANGEPLAEVEACAVSVSAPAAKSCDETDADGEYELHTLPTGYYSVGFWGRGRSAEYVPWYYEGKSSLVEATPVHVVATTTTTIEPTLVKGAQVGGVVTAAAGGAVEGIPVCLFEPGVLAADRCTESAAGGTYSFQGLATGLYQVGFALGAAEIAGGQSNLGVGGYLPQFFDRVSGRAEAQTLMLSGSQIVTGIDAALVTPTVVVPPPPPPVTDKTVAAPPTISEPVKPAPLKCKKGFVKKKVKGSQKCVKSKPAKKKKQKKHRKGKAKKSPHKKSAASGPKH